MCNKMHLSTNIKSLQLTRDAVTLPLAPSSFPVLLSQVSFGLDL